ncbi:molybdopterin-dependent oxidoreductase [Dyella jejuensis]|uniref:Molybdopterin-dependent oxidoreductase n=1 Tax=Dyella jejuensis TaxID=1432009 RepID=A0ABW8JFT0_9GAMM
MGSGKGHARSLSAAFALACVAWPALGRDAAPSAPSIRVLVDGRAAITLDRAALAAMPRTTVNTPAIHHEPAAQWQGVALEELLQRAGAPGGEHLRGHAMTTIVRVIAADHYQVVFSLGELDPSLGHEPVLLADTQDGHALTTSGPFRLIVPGDRRPARWVRSVTTVEAGSDASVH